MARQFQSVNLSSSTVSAGSGIKPFDQEGGGLDPVILTNAVVGIAPFSFSFFNGGGTDNLLPGRVTTRTAPLQYPDGASEAYVCLTGVTGSFVTDGGADLTERPLGQFYFASGFADHDTLSCSVALSDSNGDDPVMISISGIVFFHG